MAVTDNRITHALNNDSVAELFNVTQFKNTATRSLTDDSLAVTAKILLTSRAQEDSRKTIIKTHMQEYASEFTTSNIEGWVDFSGCELGHEINLNIVYMVGFTFDELLKRFSNCIEGKQLKRNIHIDNTLTAYLKAVVINTDDGVSTVFVPVSSHRKSTIIPFYHKVASAIPKFKCFEKFFRNKPATEEELRVLVSLTDKDNNYTVWHQFADKYYASLDVDRLMAGKMLKGFARNKFQQQIDQYTRYISDNHDRIDRAIRNIADYRSSIEEYEIELSVLKARLARGENGDQQLIDFVVANKNIKLVRKNGNQIIFHVLADLCLHNEEMLEVYLKNSSSNMYTSSSMIPHNVPLARQFYTEIFLNNRWQLKTIGEWSLDNNGVCNARRHAFFDAADLEHRLPNPHIQYFNCIGGHKTALADAAKEANHELALLTAVQSTMSINWGDSTVMSYFMNDLWGTRAAVFYQPEEDRYYTRDEILEIICSEHPELNSRNEIEDEDEEELTF